MKSALNWMGVACAVALIPTAASAIPVYVDQLPNGSENRCGTCHVSAAGGGARNAFGTDAENNKDNGAIDWAAIYDLDSDGDGQTNGEELGDPCGEWTSGTPARTTDISNPGDDQDTSADPNTPSCGEEDAGVEDPPEDAGVEEDAGVAEPDAGPEEDGGTEEPEPAPEPEEPEPTGGPCSSTKVPSTSAPLLSLALLGLLGLVRRRRD